jgi:hypothetical protein
MNLFLTHEWYNRVFDLFNNMNRKINEEKKVTKKIYINKYLSIFLNSYSYYFVFINK